MHRPRPLKDYRYVGDKRTQRVYDLNEVSNKSVIEELAVSEQYLVFGPDTLVEARNRGYRLRVV